MKITKGTVLSHYACGNLVSAEVVYVGGNKIVTRHELQISISGQGKAFTPIEWNKSRNKPLPLAYMNDQLLTEKHFR
jgi:hypothetical protein